MAHGEQYSRAPYRWARATKMSVEPVAVIGLPPNVAVPVNNPRDHEAAGRVNRHGVRLVGLRAAEKLGPQVGAVCSECREHDVDGPALRKLPPPRSASPET